MFLNFLGGQPQQRMPSRITFFQELKVFPASYAFRQDIESGDKILLPASALGELYPLISAKNKDPLVFCIKNAHRITYCGVLEFVAEQGLCYIPSWMFKMLKFTEPGTQATVALVPDMKKKNSNQPHFIKIRPHLTRFIQMKNPKAVLEVKLRKFTCLHQGDTITINIDKDKYQIDILEIRPKNDYNAICIINTDVQVDFAPPLDYEEKSAPHVVQNAESSTSTFKGKGVRIDQKALTRDKQDKDANQYDPRKHRIHRGVRKASGTFLGAGTKIDPNWAKKK